MTQNSISPPEILKTKIAKNSFINRAIKTWNELPEDFHSIDDTLDSFKVKTKEWVKLNIPI